MRGRVELKIESWTPRHHPGSKQTGQGATQSEFYEQHALVTVYSFPGDEGTSAFTTVEAYYHNKRHIARLPKFYHARWHARIAHTFDWQISRIGGGA